MAIKIVEDGPDIEITRSEYERALREYQQSVMFMVNPPTFEEWLRAGKAHTVTNAGTVLPG